MSSERNDRITGRMTLSVGDHRFDNNPIYGNNQLPGAPPYCLRAESRYDSPGGFFIGPNPERLPMRGYVDNVNNPGDEASVYAGIQAHFWSGAIETMKVAPQAFVGRWRSDPSPPLCGREASRGEIG